LNRDPIGSSSGSHWLLFTAKTKDHSGQFYIVSHEIAFGLQLSFYILGLSLSNAVSASDWTCGLAYAKKIVSDNFSAGMECLC
jgi:hypothetical protein